MVLSIIFKLFLHYLFIVIMFWVGSSFQMFVLPNQMCTLDASHALRSCIRCAIHAPDRLLHLEMRLNITPLLVLYICSKYNSDIHCLFADVTGLHNFLLVRWFNPQRLNVCIIFWHSHILVLWEQTQTCIDITWTHFLARILQN